MADEKGVSSILNTAWRHPISAINLVMLLIGGTGFYHSIQGRLDQQERVNVQLRKEIDDIKNKAETKFDQIQADMSELKAGIRGVDASLQFLIRQNTRP